MTDTTEVTSVIDVLDFGIVFVALAVMVGVLLIVGAYHNFVRGRIPVAMLCLGTLIMLFSPMLGIIVMVAAAIVIALKVDTMQGLISLLMVVVAYIACIVIVFVVSLIAGIAGVV